MTSYEKHAVYRPECEDIVYATYRRDAKTNLMWMVDEPVDITNDAILSVSKMILDLDLQKEVFRVNIDGKKYTLHLIPDDAIAVEMTKEPHKVVSE